MTAGDHGSPQEFDALAAAMKFRAENGDLSGITHEIVSEALLGLDMEDVTVQLEAARHAGETREMVAGQGMPLTRETLDQLIAGLFILGAQLRVQPGEQSWSAHWLEMRLAGISLLVDEVAKREAGS